MHIWHVSTRNHLRVDMGSIPELELMGNFGIAYLKKGIGINKFGIEVCYKKFIPQIDLPFNC